MSRSSPKVKPQQVDSEQQQNVVTEELSERQQHVNGISQKYKVDKQITGDLEANEKLGVRVDFKQVCVDVKLRDGSKKRILDNVSGYVLPGEMLYIMGPSGGGKTTLLDFLCDRTFNDPSTSVYLDSQVYKKEEFQKIARYCQQQTTLYEILTVQETLNYAASFFTKSKKERDERVDKVIELLGLENQRETKIGGLFYRGISGGQQKRVSVGEQLVANPKLLFLDEPTSGLDSASAYQLMEKLKQICKKTGITIISSIHQPSQRVFNLSDRLLVLAGGKGFGGNVAYFGETKHADQYFQDLGLENQDQAAAAEWVLDQVNGDFGNDQDIKKILDFYKNSKNYKDLVQDQQNLSSQLQHYQYKGIDTKQNCCSDMLVLYERGIKNNFKNPLALGIRVILYSAMALVVGTVWFQKANEPDAGDIQNISGVLFFMSTFYAFMTVSVLPVNLEDRMIMVKEKSNGAYSLTSYSITYFLVALPITFIVALLAGSIVYFMVGFDYDRQFDDYLIFILNLFVAITAPESMMLIVSNIFSHLLICIVVAAFLFGSFMIMNGFFIKIEDIPAGWKWLHYAAFNTYAFENFMVGGYRDKTIEKNMEIVPPAENDFSGNLVLKDLDMEDADVAVNILIMVAFIVVFRLVAFTYSHFKHTGKK